MNTGTSHRVFGYPASIMAPLRWPSSDECSVPIETFEELVDLLEAMELQDPNAVMIQTATNLERTLRLCRVLRQHTTAPIRVVAAAVDPEELTAADVTGISSLHDLADGYDEIIELIKPQVTFPAQSQMRVGTLLIDAARRKVEVNGIGIKLTKTEYEILLRLAGDPGEVVTRGEMVTHLWGDRWFGAPNVLDTHLVQLRTKLRKAGHDNALVTVRGVGFYFEPQVPQRQNPPEVADRLQTDRTAG